MRLQILAIAACFGLSGPTVAADPPLAEKYLHSGEFAKGEQSLEAALAASPKDDQVRFGLGLLRFARAVERLGQSLHEYGAKAENADLPFLRLPVPSNPDPAPISYFAFRRILDDFARDLSAAEATLAGITNENVKLPLRLAAVRFDFAGTGHAADSLIDIIKKLTRQRFDFLKDNPEFKVCFDRGDVAWFRAYCHLLCAMADVYLAFDLEGLFNQYAEKQFARLKNSDKVKKTGLDFSNPIVVREPSRLTRFRKHVLKVCELNHETWKFIRAEKDNDFEWLPNAKQTGVIGLPVRDEMIDAWLGMIDELAAVFNGKKMIPASWVSTPGHPTDQGLNLQKLLDNPPNKIDLNLVLKNGVPAQYLQKGPEMNIQAVLRAAAVFTDSFSVAYAAWFN